MEKILKSLLLSILLMIIMSSISFAVLDIDFVDDNSNIINNDIESLIICANQDLYEKTGVTITLVTRNSLNGIDSKAYARSYEAEVTKSVLNTNKNIIIVVSKNDKKCDIYIPEGLNTFITATETNKILSSYMVPYFQKSNWNLGVEKGFTEVVKLLENHYNIDVIVDTDEIEEMSKELAKGTTSAGEVIGYGLLFVIFFGGLLYTFTHGSSFRSYGVKKVGNPYRGYKFKKESGFSFLPYNETDIEGTAKPGKREKKKAEKRAAKKEKHGISRMVPKKSKGKRVKSRDDDEQLTKDFFDIYKY